MQSGSRQDSNQAPGSCIIPSSKSLQSTVSVGTVLEAVRGAGGEGPHRAEHLGREEHESRTTQDSKMGHT